MIFTVIQDIGENTRKKLGEKTVGIKKEILQFWLRVNHAPVADLLEKIQPQQQIRVTDLVHHNIKEGSVEANYWARTVAF